MTQQEEVEPKQVLRDGARKILAAAIQKPKLKLLLTCTALLQTQYDKKEDVHRWLLPERIIQASLDDIVAKVLKVRGR